MNNLIFNDRYQSDTEQPSGTDGHDDRKRVSWNAWCATVEEVKDALEDQYKRGNGK